MPGASGPARLQQVFDNFAKIIDNPLPKVTTPTRLPRHGGLACAECQWICSSHVGEPGKIRIRQWAFRGNGGVWTIQDMGWRPQGVLK